MQQTHPRPRNRALCCDCGEVRTVAQSYRGRTPENVRPSQDERRLAGLAAEGVTVVRVMSADDMQIDDADLEVVEYDDTRGLQVRVCATATPAHLLRGLEAAEDIVDDPSTLGEWRDTSEGRVRGLALRA